MHAPCKARGCGPPTPPPPGLRLPGNHRRVSRLAAGGAEGSLARREGSGPAAWGRIPRQGPVPFLLQPAPRPHQALPPLASFPHTKLRFCPLSIPLQGCGVSVFLILELT